MIQQSLGKSYANFGLQRSYRQVVHAWRGRQTVDGDMQKLFQLLKRDESRMTKALGHSLENCDMLEIGPGQGMERALYFQAKNRVTVLDMDVVPFGFQPRAYGRMLRRNGLGRVAKTLGRSLIIGRANRQAWQQLIGADQLKPPQILYGDIGTYPLAKEAYDVIVSWSVFEHLPNPKAALENMMRALRPGGVFYISLHLYTSYNGHHDIRAFTGQEATLPLWGHLRPSIRHLIQPSSYLNAWRLAQWRDLFLTNLPECQEFLASSQMAHQLSVELTSDMKKELQAYTPEELSAIDAIYLWRKPTTG